MINPNLENQNYLSIFASVKNKINITRIKQILTSFIVKLGIGLFPKHHSMKKCHLCNTTRIEDEKHFLLNCPFHKHIWLVATPRKHPMPFSFLQSCAHTPTHIVRHHTIHTPTSDMHHDTFSYTRCTTQHNTYSYIWCTTQYTKYNTTNTRNNIMTT